MNHNARTSWLGVAAAFVAVAVIAIVVVVALGSSAFGEPSYVPEVPSTVPAATAAVVTPEITG